MTKQATAIQAEYAAEYDRLHAEYEAARQPEGIIDRFRHDLTAQEQAAIEHNDRLLADLRAATAAIHDKRVVALAEAEGVPVAVVERRYALPVMAS